MYINLLSNAMAASATCEAIKSTGMYAKVINVVDDGRAVLMLVSSENPLPVAVGELSQATNDGVTMFVINDTGPAKLNGKAVYVNRLDEIGRPLNIITDKGAMH